MRLISLETDLYSEEESDLINNNIYRIDLVLDLFKKLKEVNSPLWAKRDEIDSYLNMTFILVDLDKSYSKREILGVAVTEFVSNTSGKERLKIKYLESFIKDSDQIAAEFRTQIKGLIKS